MTLALGLHPLFPERERDRERRATRPNGERGYSTRCQMLGPECPEAVLPDRALYLPTLSHFLIVNNILSLFLSRSLSLSLSLSRARALSLSLSLSVPRSAELDNWCQVHGGLRVLSHSLSHIDRISRAKLWCVCERGVGWGGGRCLGIAVFAV
jgi:hypothetical protein